MSKYVVQTDQVTVSNGQVQFSQTPANQDGVAFLNFGLGIAFIPDVDTGTSNVAYYMIGKVSDTDPTVYNINADEGVILTFQYLYDQDVISSDTSVTVASTGTDAILATPAKDTTPAAPSVDTVNATPSQDTPVPETATAVSIPDSVSPSTPDAVTPTTPADTDAVTPAQ